MSMTARQPFGERSMAGARKLPAALLMSMRGGPRAATASATQASTRSGSRTSTCEATASTPWARQSAAVSSIGSARRPHTATGAPRSASASAKARPMPVPPPVIRTGRASNVVMPVLRIPVQICAVVGEHVLGECRDGGRGVTERVAETLRRAPERNAVENVPDGAGERLGRIAGLAAEARRELRAALLQVVRARTESARGIAQLIDVARACHAQPVVVDGRRQSGFAGGLERSSQLGALLPGEAERAVDGCRDLGRLGDERSLLGRLAERREHRRLLHAARIGEREPAG